MQPFNHGLHRKFARRSSDVIRAEAALLKTMDYEIGKIADVNDLNRIGSSARDNHFATKRSSHRPVSESTGGVPGAHDKSRAEDCNSSRHGLSCGLLAEGFAAAVIGE